MSTPETKPTKEALRKSALLKLLSLPPKKRKRWAELETKRRASLAKTPD